MTAKLPDELYWRYKKKIAPIEETPELNGPVKIIKPKKTK